MIADEAHSSQSGRTAVKLREVLTAEQLDEDAELSSEDVINLTLEARKASGSISYFAFTATPKAKTLELFGRPPIRRSLLGRATFRSRFTCTACGRRSRRGSFSMCSATT